MWRAALLAALILFGGAALAAAAPVEKRVYKVDSVIAMRHGRNLVIQAKGAVESGGWRNPRLKVMRGSPAHTVMVEFVAQPPPPDMTVIEALVPIAAQAVVRGHPGIVSVQAVAEANEVTSQVLH